MRKVHAKPGVEQDIGNKLAEDLCSAIGRNLQLLLIGGVSPARALSLIQSMLANLLVKFSSDAGNLDYVKVFLECALEDFKRFKDPVIKL
jgi:hypothetical protein